MNLTNKFLNAHSQGTILTTKDILKWYRENKKGDSDYTYHTTIYQLIINPLVKKGYLEKMDRGIYKINTTNPLTFQNTNFNDVRFIKEFNNEDLDEWDVYIKSKILD
jgi:hypothetical protein